MQKSYKIEMVTCLLCVYFAYVALHIERMLHIFFLYITVSQIFHVCCVYTPHILCVLLANYYYPDHSLIKPRVSVGARLSVGGGGTHMPR